METVNTRLEIQDGLALLTIDRPQALNALNSATLAEIGAHLDHLAGTGARVLIVTGAGPKSFVAGADIKEMKDKTALEAEAFSRFGQRTLLKLRDLPMPTLAAVNGFALGGGCELAMACDLIYASETASFAQPEVGLGVTPGFGGTQRLARLVGPMVAKRLCLTGERIKADEALRLGLVAGVFPAEGLLDEVRKIAGKIAAQGPVAARLIKQVIDQGLQVDLDRALEMETQAFALCFATGDQREGMGAFVEKRAPSFSGR